MHNVKFVLRDEDIQVWWGQLVFRFILGVGVCAFPHVLKMEKSNKLLPEDNFWNSSYVRCILSWGRVLGPFGGLSTGQLMLPAGSLCCLPCIEESA